MSKLTITGILAAITLLFLAIVAQFTVGFNEDQNWAFVQNIFGQTKIVNKAGMYTKWFGTSHVYPRNYQVEYHVEDGEQIRTTFNDGGTADMSTMIRFSTPNTEEKQRAFHRLFGGNMQNVENAVWGHLANSIKSAGPLMSASEHQASRKSEFAKVVQDQLEDGLYEMKRVKTELFEQVDEKGKPLTVFATEVVLKDQIPQIAQPSPLKDFGITITQFSITETEYDEQTRKQFEQKKSAFLAAERAKAQREEEVQQRLMIEEKGRREKAEYEAVALKEKAKATIEADREKEVAITNANREKEVAETTAAKMLAVAKLEKETAETHAERQLSVAKLEREAAEENAAKIIVLAKAEEEKIRLAGAITEKERVLAEISKEQSIGIAEKLSVIKVPSIIINGGSSDAENQTSTQDNLINLMLMRSFGILPEEKK